MYQQNDNSNRSGIGNLVPGFSFYAGIGDSLGELIVDFIEAIADLIGKFKTWRL